MTAHELRVHKLEQELLGLERKALAYLNRPSYLRRDAVIAGMRVDYRKLHAKWMALKDQSSMDI